MHYTIAELAKIIDARVQGDTQCVITNLAAINNAKKGDLTFLLGGPYAQHLKNTKASAVILTNKEMPNCPTNALVVDNPELSFAKIAELFNSFKKPLPNNIHPSAEVAGSCQIDPSVSIGAHCVIGEGVSIGANTVIMSGTVIGEGATIGADCLFYSNVTLYHGVLLGNRVILHSGVVVGADGFGLTQDKGRWVKIPQLGRVVIEDDVEIGANSCVDRGALDDTVVEEGVKIDNLVQIAHNVRVGAHTVMAGGTVVAGSTKIGRHCVFGGGICVNGHIAITDRVIITGMAMVVKSITEPGVYSSGTTLQSNREWRKSAIRFHQLDDMAKRLKQLERLCDEGTG